MCSKLPPIQMPLALSPPIRLPPALPSPPTSTPQTLSLSLRTASVAAATTTSSSGDADSSSSPYAAAAAALLAAVPGLSPWAAARIASKATPKSLSNAVPFVRLLRSLGFTQRQALAVVTARPRLLLCNPHAALRPKLAFFLAIGLSTKHIAAFPQALEYSLECRLRPNLAALFRALGSAAATAAAVRRYPDLIYWTDLERYLLPKLDMLHACGALRPEQADHLVFALGEVVQCSPEKLAAAVERLRDMGLLESPAKNKLFFRGLGKMALEDVDARVAVLRSLGWSDEEFTAAFCRFPHIVKLSERKVRGMHAFYAEAVGWGRDVLVRYPLLLSLSASSVAARVAVRRLLRRKGLETRDLAPYDFIMGKKAFSERFVLRYTEKHPEVALAFQGKVRVGADGVVERCDGST